MSHLIIEQTRRSYLKWTSELDIVASIETNKDNEVKGDY